MQRHIGDQINNKLLIDWNKKLCFNGQTLLVLVIYINLFEHTPLHNGRVIWHVVHKINKLRLDWNKKLCFHSGNAADTSVCSNGFGYPRYHQCRIMCHTWDKINRLLLDWNAKSGFIRGPSWHEWWVPIVLNILVIISSESYATQETKPIDGY